MLLVATSFLVGASRRKHEELLNSLQNVAHLTEKIWLLSRNFCPLNYILRLFTCVYYRYEKWQSYCLSAEDK